MLFNVDKALSMPDFRQIVVKRGEVLDRFGPRFRDPLSLTKQDYLDFLSFKHNHHWTGLERPGRQATDNMEILREAIALLVDETKPISERFNTALSLVRGAGAATLTLDAQFGVAAGPRFLNRYTNGHFHQSRQPRGDLPRRRHGSRPDRGAGAGGLGVAVVGMRA